MKNLRNNLKKYIFTILIISILQFSSNQDYSFFYDNSIDKIYFSIYKKGSSDFQTSSRSSPDELLTSTNRQKEYEIETKNGKIKIEYYKVFLNNSIDSPITLVKASTKSGIEIIMDSSTQNSEKEVFPTAYSNSFSIIQSKEASKKLSEQLDKKIYDTFGFQIRNEQKINYDIDKVLLVTYEKNTIVYLANLSGENTKKVDEENDLYGFYLKNLPENFGLQVTLALKDDNGNLNGEKILVTHKDYSYPNYKVEKSNPNRTMLIISVIFIFLMFLVTLVFVIVTICVVNNQKN